MHDQLEPFGFGRKTGIDIDGEVTGLLPSTEWKRHAPTRSPSSRRGTPARRSRWASARATTTSPCCSWPAPPRPLVSGGQRYKPRLVREVEDVVTRERREVANDALPPLPLKPEHVELIIRAMYGVTQDGTRRARPPAPRT